MHTFLSYRMEMLNDPLLQITWKSLASSCKERGVFFASGPVVVGIIIAHSSHSWDFQNYLRWPDPTKLLKSSQCGLPAEFSRILITNRKIHLLWRLLTYVPVRDWNIRSSQPERPPAGAVSQYVTQIQFDVKVLIDEEAASHARALCQIHHSQKKPCQR